MSDTNGIAAAVNAVWGKARTVQEDLTAQLADILVFLGYFALCLYVGGVAYINSFNSVFRANILSDDGVVPTSLLFVNKVLWSPWIGVLTVLTILVLATVFFLSRFVLQLWFGLSLILIVFSVILIVSAGTGSKAGDIASRAIKTEETLLPTFKLGTETDAFSDGSYRLLHDSGTHLYVFQTVGDEASQVEITVLQKLAIPSYEVLSK